MSGDVSLVCWQGGISLLLALLWIGLWQLPFMQRRYNDSAVPVNGVMFIFSIAGFISGVFSFTVDNWLLYALMALGLSVALVMAVVPLLYWRFPALVREAGRGLMMPWTVTGLSLVAFGLLRLTCWLVSDIWSLVWGLIWGLINEF